MLHFLLVILKILGIVLLILLGILLFLVLLVLFVPVRYKGYLKKTDRPEGDVPGGGLSVSWLLGFLHADLAYRFREGAQVSFRLAGRSFSSTRNGEVPQPSVPSLSSGPAKTSDRTASTQTIPSGSADSGKTSARTIPSGTVENRKTSAHPDRPGIKIKQTEEKRSADAASAGKDKPAANPRKIKKIRKKPVSVLKEKWTAFQNMITDLVLRLIEFLLSIMTDILDFLFSFPYQNDLFPEKAAELTGKVKKARNFLVRYEVSVIAGYLFREAGYLIRHYRPRRVSGWARFGTGDPAVTGWILGGISLILPECAEDYTTEPDFYDPCFETETFFTGRLRICHAVKSLAAVLLRRRTIRLIKGLLKRRKGE